MMDENTENDNFYHRIYGVKNGTIWETEIHEFLHANKINLEVMGVIDEEDSDNMDVEAEELLFIDNKDREIALLIRDRKLDSDNQPKENDATETENDTDVLAEELDEFRDMINDFYPEKNRKWVLDFFNYVKFSYVFTLNTENIDDENWESIARLCEWLRDDIQGIELSDGGMITNQDGDVVLVIPDDENDPDPEREEWYPIQVALRDGDAWEDGEVETAEDAAAFISGKILE